MIEYVNGNMFESGADCLINTVNCEGYMGKGIAYQFKMKFPENNISYIKACKLGNLRIGSIHYYIEDGITIVNFPTKNKWRADSKIEYIEKGLDKLVELLPKLKVKKIAIPPLGCGNGGLIWEDVKAIIENKITGISDQYHFLVFEPSKSYSIIPKKPPKISLSGIILLDIRLHLNKFNDIRLQKAGYFVNLFYREEYFKFDEWRYGPCSQSIDIAAKSIKEYQKYYDIKDSQTTFNNAYQVICSEKVDNKYSALHAAVQKATDYINKIKTDKMLECVATVLYLIQNGESKDEEKVITVFKSRSEDKENRFSEKDIRESINFLEETEIISKDLWGNYKLIQNIL